jgi:hypothetical protein
METKLYGGQVTLTAPPVYRISPASQLASETQLTVGAALINVLTVAPDKTYIVVFRNESTGGQIIRYGIAPSFGAPAKGTLMNPGDVIILDNIAISFNVIANGAGALFGVSIYSTA